MATVVKKGNTNYIVFRLPKQFGEKKGAQIWEPTTSIQQANLRKAEIEAMLNDGRAPAHSRLTFEEFVNQKYIPVYAKKTWKNTTYDTNMGIIRNHLIPEFGTCLLRKIKPFAVEQYLAGLTEKKIISNNKNKNEDDLPCISGRTANYIYLMLKIIMSKAVEWKELSESPVICGEPCPDYRPEERAVWDPNMFNMILDSIEHKLLHLAVHLSFRSSMREGEIAGLPLENIDFDGCKILIDRQIQRVSKDSLNKLSKQHVLSVLDSASESKTTLIVKHYPKNSEARVNSISPALRDELLAQKNYIEKCKEFYGDSYQDHGLVFCFDDGRPVEPKLFMRWFSKWQKEHGGNLGLERVVFHSIRHSSTSYKLILSGGDIKAVQGETGHKTSKMVTDVYGHTFGSQKDLLAQKFDSTFYGQSPDSDPKIENSGNEAMAALLKDNPDLLVNALAALVANSTQNKVC